MSLLSVYRGAVSCTGIAQPGARALMSYVLGAYPRARNLGIYNCRSVRGGRTTSLHGEGRADDFGFPLGAPEANVLAEALRVHSGELGIQCVIYERMIWSSARPYEGWRPYTGVNPHTDHLHVELSWWAAINLTVARCNSILGGSRPIPPTSGPAPAPVRPAPARPAPTNWMEALQMRLPTINPGDDGFAVKVFQEILNAHGGFPGHPLVPDGSYGPTSQGACRDKQRDWRIKDNAVVGPQTWSAALNLPDPR